MAEQAIGLLFFASRTAYWLNAQKVVQCLEPFNLNNLPKGVVWFSDWDEDQLWFSDYLAHFDIKDHLFFNVPLNRLLAQHQGQVEHTLRFIQTLLNHNQQADLSNTSDSWAYALCQQRYFGELDEFLSDLLPTVYQPWVFCEHYGQFSQQTYLLKYESQYYAQQLTQKGTYPYWNTVQNYAVWRSADLNRRKIDLLNSPQPLLIECECEIKALYEHQNDFFSACFNGKTVSHHLCRTWLTQQEYAYLLPYFRCEVQRVVAFAPENADDWVNHYQLPLTEPVHPLYRENVLLASFTQNRDNQLIDVLSLFLSGLDKALLFPLAWQLRQQDLKVSHYGKNQLFVLIDDEEDEDKLLDMVQNQAFVECFELD